VAEAILDIQHKAAGTECVLVIASTVQVVMVFSWTGAHSARLMLAAFAAYIVFV